MNATSISRTANVAGPNPANAFRDKWRTIFAELRHGLKLAIEAYGHGIAPPM